MRKETVVRLKALKIKGKVSSGKGEGARFIEFPKVRRQIEEELGFTPYPGTLNLRLAEGELHKRSLLEKAEGKEVSLALGFHAGRVFEASLIEGLPCGVVIPQTPNYPENKIEVIAPIRLRRKLNLEDGDSVKVEIKIGGTSSD